MHATVYDVFARHGARARRRREFLFTESVTARPTASRPARSAGAQAAAEVERLRAAYAAAG